MTKFEDPIQFDIDKKIGDTQVTYSELMEICQSGPVTGFISINGKSIESYRFSGPWLLDNDNVYVPAYINNFWNSGFRIAQIHCKTLDIKWIGNKKELICLERIDSSAIYFYRDLNKTVLDSFNK